MTVHHWLTRRRPLIRSRAPEPSIDALMASLRTGGWEHDGDTERRLAAKRITFVLSLVASGRISDQEPPDEQRRGREDGR